MSTQQQKKRTPGAVRSHTEGTNTRTTDAAVALGEQRFLSGDGVQRADDLFTVGPTDARCGNGQVVFAGLRRVMRAGSGQYAFQSSGRIARTEMPVSASTAFALFAGMPRALQLQTTGVVSFRARASFAGESSKCFST